MTSPLLLSSSSRKLYFFLKRLEKFTGLDNVYFIKGGFFALIQHTIGLIAGIGISYIFGHFISKTEYGQYNLILSILSILTIISLPGIETPLLQTITHGLDKSFPKAIRIRFLSSLTGIPILLLVALIYFSKNQMEVTTLILCTVPFFPFLYSLQLYQTFLSAKHRFDLVSLFSSTSSILLLIFTFISSFLKPVVPLLILSYLIAMILPALVALNYIKKQIKPSKVDNDLFKYGLFLTLNSAFSWIVANLSNILLASIVNLEELAILSVANKFPNSIQKIYASLSKPITTKIAGQDSKNQIRTIYHHWWKLLAIGFVLCSILWFSLPVLLSILFPHGYEDARTYARWLSTTFIPLPLSWVLSDIITLQRKKKTLIFINISSNIIKIISLFIVLPLWKTTGLVIMHVVEDYVLFFIYVIIFLRIRYQSS